ncbi:hypothetical protein [Flavobacterium alkalisoli]|uniref:hypothetical protein n=1 Tax=Flavobacterium alkalisoli TaxID=2602769 RepID=UPI003A94A1EF
MNKPENVRLEVFKFNLSPRRQYNGTNTFREVFIRKTESTENIDNQTLFTNFFQHFIQTVDTEYQVLRNKAFTLINDGQTNFNSSNNTIFGVLEGGPLGEGKTRRRLSNKSDGNTLDGNVINDKYFFYIYMPLDDSSGYIMFQIYQQDSIRYEFLNFIFKEIFRIEPDFNMPNYDPYFPQSIIDEFKSSAKVKEIKFTETVLSQQIDEAASFTSINESYKIEVKVTPVRSNFGTQMLDTILPPLFRKSFNNTNLSDFDNKKIVLQNRTTRRNATFDMDGVGDIMPRIYLYNRININAFGIPDFRELKNYCDELLRNILDEEPTVDEI